MLGEDARYQFITSDHQRRLVVLPIAVGIDGNHFVVRNQVLLLVVLLVAIGVSLNDSTIRRLDSHNAFQL